MRFFTTTPIFLLLALALSSAQGQNAPASAAPSTPAAVKPAEKKDEPTKVDAKTTAATTAASTAAAKPAAATATDAKKPADASNKAGAAPVVANTKIDAKKPISGVAPAASSTPADDGSSAKTAKAEGPPCVVAEFREIGIDEQDVTKRRTRALSWLQQRAKQCSVEQLLMIRNNRSQWMGIADSARLASVVDALLEAIAAQNPRVAALLYGTPPPPSPDEKK